jgi:uracil-DNA glycosylase
MNPFPFELEPSWLDVLKDELQKPYIASLAAFIKRERSLNIPVYPPEDLVFNAFLKTPFHQVKVLIMGQDPYHGPGQAHGLSFSVPKGVPSPPSLQNIFKELNNDLQISPPPHGCLLSWAEQGVLLLNALLTVRQSEPMSHQGKGWELFTDAVVQKLCERQDPVIFVLWGKSAQEKCRFKAGEQSPHFFLKSPHPSPLSAHQGFFNSKPFSKVNALLTQQGKKTINWSLPLG